MKCKAEKLYQTHHLDSERWQFYTPREGDIVIATPHKAGTTWMQSVVFHLLYDDAEALPIKKLSPWLDNRIAPIETVIDKLNAQTGPRVIKTHLALDGIPYYPEVKYLCVGRDPRDIAISLWNFYRGWSDLFLQKLNKFEKLPPIGQCPDSFEQFFELWSTQSIFPGHSNGYPFWSDTHVSQTWWNSRHLPNILHVHFNDMLQDLQSEVSRIASYLGVEADQNKITRVVESNTFSILKTNAEKLTPVFDGGLKNGASSFFRKGTSGQWKEIFTPHLSRLYEDMAQRSLSADCRMWLEHGTYNAHQLMAREA